MSFIKTSFAIRGNLTKDATIREAGKNTYAVNLDVAVSDRVYNQTTKAWENTNPQYFRVVKFVQNKDYFVSSAVKGAPILATGEIRQRIWEDKDTQKKMVAVELIADNLEFLVRPVKDAAPVAPAAPAAPVAPTAPAAEDPDLPF